MLSVSRQPIGLSSLTFSTCRRASFQSRIGEARYAQNVCDGIYIGHRHLKQQIDTYDKQENLISRLGIEFVMTFLFSVPLV